MSRAAVLPLGLVIALFGSSVKAIESRVIDNTPTLPSICQITPNSKISYGQVVRVISPDGAAKEAVFDQNYDDEFAGLFSGRNSEDRKLFFTVWFSEGILFTAHQSDPLNRANWTSYRMYGTTSEYGTDDRFSYFIRVEGSLYPLEILEVADKCKYGEEEASWHRNVSGRVALKFSDEARTALKNSQLSDKIAIVYRRKDGNKTYETTTAIGSGTITAWKRLAIMAPETTSKQVDRNPMEAKVRRHRETMQKYAADTQGWVVMEPKRIASKYESDGWGAYTATDNVNCRVAPSPRAPVAYVVPKTYTILPFFWCEGKSWKP